MIEMKDKSNSILPSIVPEPERRIFEKINSLVLQGALFLGNHWVNHPKMGGCFKIELKYRGRVIPYYSSHCHPRTFGPPS